MSPVAFCCTCRSVHCSALIREPCSCSRWWFTETPPHTLCNMQRVRALNGVSLSLQERGRKILRARMIRDFEETAFPRQQSRCPSRLRDMTTCTRHTQAMARQNPRRRGSGQSPTPSKKLFTKGSCWEKGVHNLQWSGPGYTSHTPGELASINHGFSLTFLLLF